MFSLAIILAAAGAGAGLFWWQRRRFERTWKRLSSAVPDQAHEALPYRSAEQVEDLVPTSKKALEFLPASRRAKRLQMGLVIFASPVFAAFFAVFPATAVAAWSALFGALVGLGTSAALLQDRRETLVAIALLSLPLAFFSPWAAVFNFSMFALARFVLDRKDSAGKNEAERERLADPRFLVMSREGRAAGIARSRSGGGGESSDSPPKDHLKA